MIRLLPLLLLACACGNYGNIYLPQGERKPFTGPDPKDFPAALAAPLKVESSAKIRLNIAPGRAATLRAGWNSASPATVVWRVNARKIAAATCGPGDCETSAAIPQETIVPGTATLVEIETSVPITVARLAIEH